MPGSRRVAISALGPGCSFSPGSHMGGELLFQFHISVACAPSALSVWRSFLKSNTIKKESAHTHSLHERHREPLLCPGWSIDWDMLGQIKVIRAYGYLLSLLLHKLSYFQIPLSLCAFFIFFCCFLSLFLTHLCLDRGTQGLNWHSTSYCCYQYKKTKG